jgi:hypothetical protein
LFPAQEIYQLALGQGKSFFLSAYSLSSFYFYPIPRDWLRNPAEGFVSPSAENHQVAEQTKAQKIAVFVVKVDTSYRCNLLDRVQAKRLEQPGEFAPQLSHFALVDADLVFSFDPIVKCRNLHFSLLLKMLL